jgi:hypothetical protein
LPAGPAAETMTRKNNAKYDWISWFARPRFTLRRGVHYHCSQTSMAGQVRNAATRLGVSVSIIDEGSALTVVVREPARALAPEPV